MARALPRLIGVIHLPPLPGSPGASHLNPGVALSKAGLWAVREAVALTKAGFDGLILENFGDTPFYKSQVPPETIASMAVIAAAVRESTRVALGINVLRNDARSALAIAAATQADFIRVNVLAGVAATDQGLIEGDAAFLLRERARLNASSIAILADVHVKHAQTLSSVDLSLAIEEVAGRGGADGVILTGTSTGRAPELESVKRAIEAATRAGVPLYLGSGVSSEQLTQGLPREIRIIIGSALRKNGLAGAPLELKRMKKFIQNWKLLQKKGNGKTRRATS